MEEKKYTLEELEIGMKVSKEQLSEIYDTFMIIMYDCTTDEFGTLVYIGKNLNISCMEILFLGRTVCIVYNTIEELACEQDYMDILAKNMQNEINQDIDTSTEVNNNIVDGVDITKRYTLEELKVGMKVAVEQLENVYDTYMLILYENMGDKVGTLAYFGKDTDDEYARLFMLGKPMCPLYNIKEEAEGIYSYE